MPSCKLQLPGLVTAAAQGPAVVTVRAHLDLVLVILAIQQPPGIESCLASLGVCIFDQRCSEQQQGRVSWENSDTPRMFYTAYSHAHNASSTTERPAATSKRCHVQTSRSPVQCRFYCSSVNAAFNMERWADVCRKLSWTLLCARPGQRQQEEQHKVLTKEEFRDSDVQDGL